MGCGICPSLGKFLVVPLSCTAPRRGYRYTGAAAALNRAFIAAVHAPICLAGSVNSFARLDEIKATGAAYFTIGSAFFAHAFGGDIADQINTVCDYMEAPHA